MNHELAVVQEGNLSISISDQFASQKSFFSTIDLETATKKDRIRLTKAITNADASLGECINMKMKIVDLVAHEADVNNIDTGELVKMTRVVLLAEDGVAYHTVSTGIVSCVKTFIPIMGVPTREEPWDILVKQNKIGNNKTLLTIELLDEE